MDITSTIANNIGAVAVTGIFTIYLIKSDDRNRKTIEKFITTIQIYQKQYSVVINNLSLKLQKFTQSQQEFSQSQLELKEVIRQLYEQLIIKSKKITTYERGNDQL